MIARNPALAGLGPALAGGPRQQLQHALPLRAVGGNAPAPPAHPGRPARLVPPASHADHPRDFTLLLPVPESINATLPANTGDFAPHLMLLTTYASLEALAAAGAVPTLANSTVQVTGAGAGVVVSFDGLGGATAALLPIALPVEHVSPRGAVLLPEQRLCLRRRCGELPGMAAHPPCHPTHPCRTRPNAHRRARCSS